MDYSSAMRSHSSPTKSPHTDSIWSHYRCAVSRIAKELHRESPTLLSEEESENTPVPEYPRQRPNKMSVTYRRSEHHTSLKQIDTNLSVDHNSNRYRLRSRPRPSELERQLSMDLEDARTEIAVLRRRLDEKSETITKLKGEITVKNKEIRKLSAGRHSERSKWSGDREGRDENEKSDRHNYSVQSVSLSELSPVNSRKANGRRQSTITYSSETRESSSVSTPKKPTNPGWLPPIPLPTRITAPQPAPPSDRENRLQPQPTINPISTSTPKRTVKPTSKNRMDTDEESTPKRLFSEDASKSDDVNQKTPSYYLKKHRPEFINRCEKRQTAIKVAATTRARMEDERRNVARAVVEGKASLSSARPFLRADPTAVKAFDEEEMRRATQKRFRSTSEFQSRIRERNHQVEKAANHLIARCFSVNTLQRSRSFGKC
ncbi:hypothetical protein PRIPAC_97251 [Pristionchus pacificus]|uniref:Uncharacterized protein n=1 Tax=Pristionchus pacificus TaxID=54126 RepID=A0A2A6BJX6_PRIPA|nr:hypothetical protein PRIPAC_97251 [Pristionchus pacificus]|eukprot:PDM66138.1 hypothetical protein PRIPAC_45363 [Pristionchus pacificus]